MQGMRRGQQDRLHLRVRDGILEVGGQPEAMLGRQFTREFWLLAHAMHDAQALAFALD